MLKTRTPLTEVIAPGGTVQSMILLVLRVIEKQMRNRNKKPEINKGVKWELGFAFSRGWEMGLCALGQGFIKQKQ